MSAYMFTRPGDGALFCFDRGLKVFPIIPDGKIPAFKDWQEWAEKATRDKVEKFSKANPMHNWGVYAGPSNVIVLDIDVKEGKDGEKSLENLISQNGKLPNTLRCQTPTGGTHAYYLGSSKSIIGLRNGVDIKSEGGYVVAPGSRIGEASYEVVDDAPIVDPPKWFTDLLSDHKTEVRVLDDEETVITGERNQFLTSVAGTLRSRGMNYDTILAALLSVNETQVNPPLAKQEVENIARSISRYEPGIAEVGSKLTEIPALLSMRANEFNPLDIPKREVDHAEQIPKRPSVASRISRWQW